MIYEPDRVLAGGDTLFVVEGPFDALKVAAAMQPGNASVATAFYGSLPTPEQFAYITNGFPLYRMVSIMLDANIYGRCRRLAQDLAKATGAPNVGSIHIGGENRDPGATRFEEPEARVAFASASWQTEIRWMWERRLVFTGGGEVVATMPVVSINIGPKRVHPAANCPDDELGLLACDFVLARAAELLDGTSEPDLRHWLIQRDPAIADLFSGA